MDNSRRVTFNLTKAAHEALVAHMEATGDGKTETLNRALPMYTWIAERMRAGETIQICDESGNQREIKVF